MGQTTVGLICLGLGPQFGKQEEDAERDGCSVEDWIAGANVL